MARWTHILVNFDPALKPGSGDASRLSRAVLDLVKMDYDFPDIALTSSGTPASYRSPMLSEAQICGVLSSYGFSGTLQITEDTNYSDLYGVSPEFPKGHEFIFGPNVTDIELIIKQTLAKEREKTHTAACMKYMRIVEAFGLLPLPINWNAWGEISPYAKGVTDERKAEITQLYVKLIDAAEKSP